MYEAVAAKVRSAGTPEGMIVHLALTTETGMRHIEVWDTKAQWEKFHTNTVRPAVAEVLAGYGITATGDEAVVTEIDLVDSWL
jgi:hypothetical protein